ncbi:hypothetical protein DFH28DRAFT_367290 [Melampsora americana]|nr:hypothetical protein DFH28DRAFT_367290 [Melampsora americana]
MIAGNSLMRLPQAPLMANNPLMGLIVFPSRFFEFKTWLGVTTEPVQLSTSMDSSLAISKDSKFIKREDENAQGSKSDAHKSERQKQKEKKEVGKDTKATKKIEGQSKPWRNATIPNHPNQKSLRGPKRTKNESMTFDGSRRKNWTSTQATYMIHAPNPADHPHSISTHDSQINLNLGNLTRLDLKKSKDGRRKKPFGYDQTKSKNRNQTINGSTHKSSRPTSQPPYKTQALSEDGNANRTTSQTTIKSGSKKSGPKRKKIGQDTKKYPSKTQNGTDPENHSSRKPKHTAKTSTKGTNPRNITSTRTGKDKGSKKKMTMKKGKAHNLTAPSNSSSRLVPGPSTPVSNQTQVPTPVSQAPMETPSLAPTTPEPTPEPTPDQSSQDGPARTDGTPTTSKNDTMDQDSQAEKPKTNEAPTDTMSSWIITFKSNTTDDGVDQYEHKLNDTGAIIKYNYSPVLKGLAASVPDRSFTALSKDPNIDSFDPDTVMSAQPNLDGPVMGGSDVVSEDG